MRGNLWLAAMAVACGGEPFSGSGDANSDRAVSGNETAPSGESGTTVPLELRVDSSLPSDLQAATIEAVGKWSAVGAEVAVAIVPTIEANLLEGTCPEGAAGCAWPGERVHLVLEQLEVCKWAKVDGVTTCERMSFEFMILHELGHFFGIEHHLPSGNVMQEGATVPMPPAALTDDDVSALRSVNPADKSE